MKNVPSNSADGIDDVDSNDSVHETAEEDVDVQAEETFLAKPRTISVDDEFTGSSYFEAYRGTVRTSNLTLSSLNILPPSTLDKARQELTDPLVEQQQYLVDRVKDRFQELSFLLVSGQSLLFHGYGSKKTLLDDFATHQSQFSTVLVVNGFNPTIGLRSVLSQISVDVLRLGQNHARRSLLDYVDAIHEGIGNKYVTLVVHNIDGSSLRSEDSQKALAMLSRINNIFIAASVDHVNAPLLWDGVTYSKFAWAWVKADTFIPYDVETVYCSKPLLRGGGERQIEGAIALLRSLSERARKVFRLLAERQTGGEALMRETEEASRKGTQLRTTFNDLFEQSKCQFLVSEPATLQVILTELETHQLLESRRGVDAAAQLVIPLQISQLRVILKDIAPTT